MTIGDIIRLIASAPDKAFEAVGEGFKAVVSIVREPFRTVRHVAEITGRTITLGQMTEHMGILARAGNSVTLNYMQNDGYTTFTLTIEPLSPPSLRLREAPVIADLAPRPPQLQITHAAPTPVALFPVREARHSAPPLQITHVAPRPPVPVQLAPIPARVPVTFFLFLDDRALASLSVFIVGIAGRWGPRDEIEMTRIPHKGAYSTTIEIDAHSAHEIKYKVRDSSRPGAPSLWVPSGRPGVTNIPIAVLNEPTLVASYQSPNACSGTTHVELKHDDDGWRNGIRLDKVGEGDTPAHTKVVALRFDHFRFYRLPSSRPEQAWRPEGAPAVANFTRAAVRGVR